MNRRGIALVAALVAMLLAGILAATILSAARLQWLAGHRMLAAHQALHAAEGTANWEVVHWDTALTNVPIGLTVPLARPSVPSLVRSNASAVRLGSGLYLIRAVAEVTDREGGVLARDGVAQLVGESGDSGSQQSGINRVPTGAWWRWP